MATIALPQPLAPHSSAAGIPTTLDPLMSYDNADTPPTSQSSEESMNATKVPNKHIPVCPTGPARDTRPDTPPESPKSSDDHQQQSLLYPPTEFHRYEAANISIYGIDAAQIARAIDYASQQSLPHPSQVFPWFHGLHPQNHLQQTFFSARRRSSRRTPDCLRAVVLVKADGDLDRARLKGAVAPDEFLDFGGATGPCFLEVDPKDGFSVRNFQIQPAKIAITSDIIVYGADTNETKSVAWEIACCQQQWREKQRSKNHDVPTYNTFVCTASFEEFEKNYPEIVAVNSDGHATGHVRDFVYQERREMWDMSEASEISHNVFMGPTPELGSVDEQRFDILIECSDLGRLNPEALKAVALSTETKVELPFHDFPSSGSILPPTWSHTEADGILETCKWIYHIAHGLRPQSDSGEATLRVDMSLDSEDDKPLPQRKVLIHCADGYTESTMLGIAYFSYSTGRAVPRAWIDLHTQMRRNFFAYPTDVALLRALAPRLLSESPLCSDPSLTDNTAFGQKDPTWMLSLDGSLPSRILDYLYLGNLGHANNPELLQELGICQILSVGETAIWREGDLERWGEDNICSVEGVQDNGIDPLTEEFERCLEFIGKATYHY